jgi:hypothetical protein
MLKITKKEINYLTVESSLADTQQYFFLSLRIRTNRKSDGKKIQIQKRKIFFSPTASSSILYNTYLYFLDGKVNEWKWIKKKMKNVFSIIYILLVIIELLYR